MGICIRCNLRENTIESNGSLLCEQCLPVGLAADDERQKRVWAYERMSKDLQTKDAELATLRAELEQSKATAIEHQAKYVTMHGRHQELWRESLEHRDTIATLRYENAAMKAQLEEANHGLAVSEKLRHKVGADRDHYEKKLAAMDQQAGNVLARIHRDGGHYITQHGWEKACLDADVIVCRLRDQLDVSEAKRKVLAEEVNFIRHMFGATEEEGTLVWTNCDNDILEEYGQLKDATDAAKALEGT